MLLAHQGGWDEILFVLAPLILFGVLLLVARKRVERMEAEEDAQGDRPAPSKSQSPSASASASDQDDE